VRHRFPVTTAIVVGMLMVGAAISAWGCGGQPARNAETSMSTSTSVPVANPVPADGDATGYVNVLHPYHNEFLDAPSYLTPETGGPGDRRKPGHRHWRLHRHGDGRVRLGCGSHLPARV